MANKLKYYSIATVCWVLALLGATFLPGKDIPELSFELNDKIIHVLLYFMLSILFLNASWKEGFLYIPKKNVVFVVLPVIIFLAIITEYIQGFVPGRNTSYYDMVANAIGIFIGFLLFLLMRKRY